MRLGTWGLTTLCLALFFSCGPGSGSDAAPPLLEVEPDNLNFSTSEITRFLEVKNTGGGKISFTVKVSATVEGTTWLSVGPDAGTVGPGSSTSLLVSAINYQELLPGSYVGEITVEGEGQDTKNIDVTLVIGQPMLELDPATELFFGPTTDERTLLLRNTGKGELKYSLTPPAEWLAINQTGFSVLGEGETASLTLTVDRKLIPWYGLGEGTLLIINNGVAGSSGAGTAKLAVKVEVDSQCSTDADCTKLGFYCGISGNCTARKGLGDACQGTQQCHSGFCADGVCCNSACDGECSGCNEPGFAGACSPRPDNTYCNDGLACTTGETCDSGKCTNPSPLDCSDYDTACSDAICDEDAGGCTNKIPANKCLIEGKCYNHGQAVWSACQLCDSDHPITATDAAEGADCDDSNMCTIDDTCVDGECTGNALVCTDELDCTDDLCNPETGLCQFVRKPEWCIIDGNCVMQGKNPSGPDATCLSCIPYLDSGMWSAINEGMPCDDQSECTVSSACTAGACVATCLLCDDGDPCTDDVCVGDLACDHPPAADQTPCDSDGDECTQDVCLGGVCNHPLGLANCLIGGQCFVDGALNPDNVCTSCSAGVNQESWSPTNDGMGCDDGNWCTLDDACSTGTCVGAATDCGATQCQNYYCDPLAEQCNVWPKPDNLECDDGNACTVADACAVGSCQGQPKDCAAELQLTSCTTAHCDPNSAPEPGHCYAKLLPDGEPCDDGLACTTDTACTILGACTGGLETSDEDCAQLLGIGGQCIAALCSEPDGCQPDVEPDGTDCQLDNAVAKCLSGDCTLVSCVDELLYADCDNKVDTGCEVELWHDIANCGECSHLCTFPNAFPQCQNGLCSISACKPAFFNCDNNEATGCESNSVTDPTNCGECGIICATVNPSKVGICLDKKCSFVGCAPGTQNMDGNPANGCECTIGGQEICNGIDDDCNGEVDEGFDLWTDLNNCGACGTVCEPGNASAIACQNGQCLVTACPLGLVDLNGDSADGCEYEPFYVGELWVDALSGGPEADGSVAHPFATIQEAVDAALPSDMIHINSGFYAGGVVVDKVGLVLQGESPDLVNIATANGETGILVTAHDVAVLSATFSGGRYGVQFVGEAQNRLVGGSVSDAIFNGQTGPTGASLDGAGIFLEYTEAVTISNCSIKNVTGGQGAYVTAPATPNVGGLGAGIRLRWSDEAVVAGNSLGDITGGLGGANNGSGSSGCTRAPPGGIGAGIWLEHSSENLIKGNTIETVTGGTSGPGGKDYCSTANTGGRAAGINLGETSHSNHLEANLLSNLIGGLPNAAPSHQGIPQQAFGIYLDDSSLPNNVALNNSLAGDPIVYLHGAAGIEVAGLSMEHNVNPTNLGKIVVLESENVTIADNSLAGFEAEAGYMLYGLDGKWGATPGEPGRGIYLKNCTGCELRGNSVAGIMGGRGGVQTYSNGIGAAGGDSVGVELNGCQSCQVTLNSVHSTKGGICAYDPLDAAWGHGCRGVSYGLWNSSGVTFANNVAQQPQAGQSNYGCDEPAYCLYIDQTTGLAVKHFTCHAPASECGVGHGVVIGALQKTPVQVVNSIISTMAGFGLAGKTGNNGLLVASYSDIYECAAGQAQNATVSSGCIDLDPLFLNPEEYIVTLSPTSPAIDHGLGSSDCNNEPFPNGCQVNMGAYGNTAQAAGAPDADHCPACPE